MAYYIKNWMFYFTMNLDFVFYVDCCSAHRHTHLYLQLQTSGFEHQLQSLVDKIKLNHQILNASKFKSDSHHFGNKRLTVIR